MDNDENSTSASGTGNATHASSNGQNAKKAAAFKLVKSARKSIRTAATNRIKSAEALLAIPETEVEDLEDALEALNQKEDDLTQIDAKVEALIEDEAEMEKETADAIAYKERLLDTKQSLTRRIKKATRTPAGSACGSFSTIVSPTAVPSNANVAYQQEVRLPQLIIPTYDGTYENWNNFWGRFEATVGSNQRLSKVEKFIYLSSYLVGDALQTIDGLTQSGASYDEAVRLLKRRFEKSGYSVNYHMKKLYNLEPVEDVGNLRSLRNLLDTCEISLRSLEILGFNVKDKASIVCPAIMASLPSEIRTDYCIKYRSSANNVNWDIQELVDFIRDQIESREMAEFLGAGPGKSACKTKQGKKEDEKPRVSVNSDRNKHNVTARAFTAKVSNNPEVMFCAFCNADTHKSVNCNNHSLERKREILAETFRCYICLRSGHGVKYCRSKFKSCKGCHRRHNYAICHKNEVNSKNVENGSENDENKNTHAKEIVQVNSAAARVGSVGDRKVLLQTAVGILKNPTHSQQGAKIRCFLDGGSEATFIREELSRKLGLPIVGEQNLQIFSCGNEEPRETKAKMVKLRLENRDNKNEFSDIVAIELPFICYEAVGSANSLRDLEIIMESKGLKMAEDTKSIENSNTQCDLLIGADHYWDVAIENFERLSSNLMAQQTKLGWTIQGPTDMVVKRGGNGTGKSVKTMLVRVGQKQVHQTLENFWNLESLGITEKESLDISDEVTLNNFFDTVKMEDGRYCVNFPWLVTKETLPDNFAVASKRMQGLIRKFEGNPKFYEEYKGIIADQLENGVIEEVPKNELGASKPGTYYLPHQGVVRENVETTKLRVVYDASSHAYNAPSLNDCLAQGPNLYPDLLLLLLRFRKHKIAMVADIEKAFLQIKLDDQEKDSTRFLWVREKDGEISHSDFTTMRLTRVPFGVKSSPFLLACTIKHHLKVSDGVDKRVKERLDQDLYVDDLGTGADEVDEAFEISVGAAETMQRAGMKFRKWGSNSQELISKWNEYEGGLFEKGIMQKETKVLGIKWEPLSDCFKYDLNSIISYSKEVKNTKRHMLSLISQIFDPMGLISPFVIRGKMLFQKLWLQREKIGWDSETPADISEQFLSWCSELPVLNDVKIARNYFWETDGKLKRLELHCFCDSSLKGYAAAVYVKYETENNQVGAALVVSKTRIAPIKNSGNDKDQSQTIPRLELMGCLIGARLTNYIRETFQDKLDRLFFWTDSTIALGWITSAAKSWKPFVSNRVQEIQNLTKGGVWGHCPGTENPADLPTRGMAAQDLLKSELWWSGPKWLKQTEEYWPKSIPETNLEVVSYERRKLILGVSVKQKIGIQHILDLNRHNSLDKILRITAYVFRFINKNKNIGPISAVEMLHAELTWVRDIQSEEYEEELRSLKKGEEIEHSSKIAQLSPMLIDGIICVGGRIESSNLRFEEKHPIILSKNLHFSKLLMMRSHEQVLHGGINDTITQNRERYWIPANRQLARKVVKNCIKCRKTTVKQADRPTASLPSDRIDESPPFAKMGIDFAGPLFVKDGNLNNKKVYICLATCAVTRAVHLELVPSLSTDEFILALRRIISRRGLPSVIYTDNAKTFKKANTDLCNIWRNLKERELQEFFGNKGIQWKFIVERAPWHGGWWERLVRTTKIALRKILGQANFNYTELETSILEVEALINSRPITYIYNDPEEPTPLSPAEFLIGQRLNSLPPLKLENKNVPTTRMELTKRLKYRENVLNKTWKRWRHDYMMELKSAHHSKLAKNDVQFKIGDVVLIQEDKLPRHMWKIGVIREVIDGRDGRNRMCVVKTKNEQLIRRAVQHLCNLELN